MIHRLIMKVAFHVNDALGSLAVGLNIHGKLKHLNKKQKQIIMQIVNAIPLTAVYMIINPAFATVLSA